jgi:AraC-like DNA-binding protein
MSANIILIGMPASGKTTIGNLLAEKLTDYTFIDTDCFIEKTQGMKIKDIFSKFSEDYFRKTFKSIYKISPHQYILNLKLMNAEKMLKSELYSISEVSAKCGFSDYKYFSRIFKKNYGVTPSAYTNLE